MSEYTLTLELVICKDAKLFYREEQRSEGLSKEQMLDMEQDLWEVKKKWARVSGLK